MMVNNYLKLRFIGLKSLIGSSLQKGSWSYLEKTLNRMICCFEDICESMTSMSMLMFMVPLPVLCVQSDMLQKI
jgi:hypothetical protein